MKRNVLLGSALACLALVWAATPAHAQLFRGRGGSYGNYGNYGNYGHSPGYSNYGFGSGYGYHPGYSNYGNWGTGWNQYGSTPYYGSNWGSGWNNYGSGPYYGSNNTWGSGWGQNSGWSGQAYNNSYQPGYATSGQGYYDGSGYTSQGSNQAFGGQQQLANNEAMVRVMVPTQDARVSIDGHQTQQQGMQRTFITPPLQQDGGTYQIKATWTEGGKQVNRERTIQVRPGQQAQVNFMDDQNRNQSPGSASQFDQRQNFPGDATQQRTTPTS